MLSLIKFLKIVLPVATVTSATIATVSLVSFQKADDKLDRESEDKVLEDFERPVEKFEEQAMLYAKDGEGNNVAIKDKKQMQQLLKEFKENNGKLEQSDQAFDALKDRGSNNPSEDPQVENKDKEASERSDLKNKSTDGDQINQEDQASLSFATEKLDNLSGSGAEDIDSQKSEEDTDPRINELKKDKADDLPKTTGIEGDRDSSKTLASSKDGSGEENSKNCDPCPKESNSKDPSSEDEESKGLDKKEEENKKEMSQASIKDPEAGLENSDVSSQTNDSSIPASEIHENVQGSSDGVLSEETSNSSLTSPEQLDVLNGLYGQVTDILSQLQSRFSL